MSTAPLSCCCSGEGSSLQLLPHSQQSCLKRRHFYPSSPNFYPAQGPVQPELHSEPQPSQAVLDRGGSLGRGGFTAQGCSCPPTHSCCKEGASPLPPSAIFRGNKPVNKDRDGNAVMLLPASPADPPPSGRRARPARRCWR